MMRLGIVGCQGVGKHVAQIAAANPRIAVGACCDLQEDAAFTLAEAVGGVAFSSYEAMLVSGSLDAVYLATPHHLHAAMIKDAVAAGIPVLCEKPITENYQTAKSLVSFLEEHPVKVGINYQRRYDAGYHTLIRVVQSGSLGKVRYARINVPWNRDWEYFGKSFWHQKKSMAGGGTMITQASHYLDIVLQACSPAKPLDVIGFMDQLQFEGQIEVEDFAMGIIRLSNGTYIEVCSSMDAVPQRPVQIEVYGSKGTVVHTDEAEQLAFFGIPEQPFMKPPFSGCNSMERSIEAFRAWIEDELDYWVPVASALPVLACIDGLYRASAEKRVVEIG